MASIIRTPHAAAYERGCTVYARLSVPARLLAPPRAHAPTAGGSSSWHDAPAPVDVPQASSKAAAHNHPDMHTLAETFVLR